MWTEVGEQFGLHGSFVCENVCLVSDINSLPPPLYRGDVFFGFFYLEVSSPPVCQSSSSHCLHNTVLWCSCTCEKRSCYSFQTEEADTSTFNRFPSPLLPARSALSLHREGVATVSVMDADCSFGTQNVSKFVCAPAPTITSFFLFFFIIICMQYITLAFRPFQKLLLGAGMREQHLGEVLVNKLDGRRSNLSASSRYRRGRCVQK